MSIQWIFFDIGYTLVNEDAVWAKRLEEQAQTAEAIGLGLTADDLRREFIDHYAGTSYKTMIKNMQMPVCAPYRCEYEILYPEALSVLQLLSSRYRLGIIANQSAGLKERLQQWKILTFFSGIFSSADYGVSKPDLKLFQTALQTVDCPARNAVMVGDRLDNDILPAKRLGMHTVWIRQGFSVPPSSADPVAEHVITNLSQLPALFPFHSKEALL